MTGVSTADQPFACLTVNATPSVCDSPGVQTWRKYIYKLYTDYVLLLCEKTFQFIAVCKGDMI